MNPMFNTQLPNMYNMNNMMGMMKPAVFDPSKLNDQYKRTINSQNISQAKAGFFRLFQKYEHMQFAYMPKIDTGEIDRICDVQVVYEHCLQTAERYADKGSANFTKKNGMNPVVLNVVDREFVEVRESSENFQDELLNLRTTFCVCPSRNAFPIKEGSCVYTPLVLVIRPPDIRMGPILPYTAIWRTGVITSAPIKNEGLGKFSSENLVKSLTNLEAVFQCAIANEHDVLILTPYAHTTYNNPVDDIIKIYNFCIMKYSHKFKHIIISVPSYYKKEIYEIYKEGIISPSEITKCVDDKYENLNNEKKMQNKLKNVLARQ